MGYPSHFQKYAGKEERRTGPVNRLEIISAIPTKMPRPIPTSNPDSGPVTPLKPVSKPDLVITGITAPPSVVPGRRVAVSTTVRNDGEAIAASSYVYFYLSSDAEKDDEDIFLGRGYVSSVAPEAVRTCSFSFFVPRTITGQAHLCAVADGKERISEEDEGNNVGWSLAITVQNGAAQDPTPTPTPTIILQPDLIAKTVNSPDTGLVGNFLAIDVVIRNSGTTFSGATDVALYLSPDPHISPGDIYLGLLSIASVAAGSSVTVNGDIEIPATVPAGTYYLGMIIDPANKIRETSEGNNIAFSGAPIRITQTVPGTPVELQVESAILKYTNQERVDEGLIPLVEDAVLTSVARAHSLDMKERDFCSHTNPDWLSPFQRMATAGYHYTMAAENIAATSSFTLESDPDEVGRYIVQEMWMQSTGHRENILSASYTEIGIGVVYESDRSSSPYGFIATQEFARPL
jgi:uncharacterized protein YkwD